MMARQFPLGVEEDWVVVVGAALRCAGIERGSEGVADSESAHHPPLSGQHFETPT